jgi:hypothetical protein
MEARRKTIRQVCARDMYEIVREEWRVSDRSTGVRSEIAKRHNLCYGTVCKWINGASRPRAAPSNVVPLTRVPKAFATVRAAQVQGEKLAAANHKISTLERRIRDLEFKLGNVNAALDLLKEAVVD